MSESLPAREENSFISPREVPEPQNPSFGVWVSRKVVSHFLIWGIGGMADTLVLGTSALVRAGSSPVFPTMEKQKFQ